MITHKKRLVFLIMGAWMIFAMGTMADMPSNLTFITAGQGGSWYAMGGGFSRLLTEAGIKTTSEVGAGGVGNVAMIAQGKGDLGFTTTIVPPMAAEGLPPFKEKINNVQAIIKLSKNILHIAVNKDFGIKRIEDLKGKKFASQKVGNVSTEAFKAALSAVGMTEEDLKLTRGSQGFGANEMKDRRIVGFTATTNPPSPAMSDVSQTLDVEFLKLNDDIFQQMKKINPGYVRATIPPNTYRNQGEEIPTVGTDLIIIVNQEMSVDHAYWLTKVLIENLEEVNKIHGSFKNLTAKDLADIDGVMIHPGALQYFKEKGLR